MGGGVKLFLDFGFDHPLHLGLELHAPVIRWLRHPSAGRTGRALRAGWPLLTFRPLRPRIPLRSVQSLLTFRACNPRWSRFSDVPLRTG